MGAKITIDWERIEKMAMAGSNGQQISAALGIHYDTLALRCKSEKPNGISQFSEYLRVKREKGNDLLLMKQFDLAMKGDKTLLVWLGKNRLNQSDKREVTNIGGEIVRLEIPAGQRINEDNNSTT